MRQNERIAKLSKELKFIQDLIAINDHWKKKDIEAAKYVFLNTMLALMPNVDITYQICQMGMRDVVQELQSTIAMLEKDKDEEVPLKPLKEKRYTIIANLSDHKGYNGEPVAIIQELPDNQFIVSNDKAQEWVVGEEEINEITNL